MTVRVVPASPTHTTALLDVHRAAFETESEAEMVRALLAADALDISLVALDDDTVVGHVALSAVTLTPLGTSGCSASRRSPSSPRTRAAGSGAR